MRRERGKQGRGLASQQSLLQVCHVEQPCLRPGSSTPGYGSPVDQFATWGAAFLHNFHKKRMFFAVHMPTHSYDCWLGEGVWGGGGGSPEV